ncbi:hypothetical protein [Streptomyces sp. UNOC14_S4]|uniref:hypothetical protein n=1 Tax=Streptomyces sp. UNOC14_S4 TaxID=2872340 RepID=UPI001E511903|nr:hypothetical protein [Streptomyces sp. UNOC14_S4]MCC3767579.1 hypothetical protein [Streptomyces sp. UNOC14_S4]
MTKNCGTAVSASGSSSSEPNRQTLQQKLKEKHPITPSAATHGDPCGWDRDTIETFLDLSAAPAESEAGR